MSDKLEFSGKYSTEEMKAIVDFCTTNYRDFIDFLDDGEGGVIFGVYDRGIVYAGQIATILRTEGKDVSIGTLYIHGERVDGFKKSVVNGKRVMVMNEGLGDRRAAALIAREAQRYEDDFLDFRYIVTQPYTTFELDELKKEFELEESID